LALLNCRISPVTIAKAEKKKKTKKQKRRTKNEWATISCTVHAEAENSAGEGRRGQSE
jgi:hypothetical protein